MSITAPLLLGVQKRGESEGLPCGQSRAAFRFRRLCPLGQRIDLADDMLDEAGRRRARGMYQTDALPVCQLPSRPPSSAKCSRACEAGPPVE